MQTPSHSEIESFVEWLHGHGYRILVEVGYATRCTMRGQAIDTTLRLSSRHRPAQWAELAYAECGATTVEEFVEWLRYADVFIQPNGRRFQYSYKTARRAVICSLVGRGEVTVQRRRYGDYPVFKAAHSRLTYTDQAPLVLSFVDGGYWSGREANIDVRFEPDALIATQNGAETRHPRS